MGGTATPVQAGNQAPPSDDSGRGWDAAAGMDQQSAPAVPQPSGSAQPSQSPTPSTPGAPAGAAPSAMNPPAQAAPAQPVTVTSQKAPGIQGVVDSIADALVGKTTPEIGTDAQGNQYVKQTTQSRGQQWVRIGGTLLGGAAKGMAAGKGRNPGAAAAAGFDQGQQEAQQAAQQTSEAQKQILANANYQKLRMDTAEQAWHLSAMQHQASQHDVEFAQGQEDRLMKVDGATLLGTASDPNDIGSILKADPNVMQSMIKNHQIEILPHYNADGTAAGIRVFKMPDSYRKTIEPAGTTFHTFDSNTGQYTAHQTSEPITAGEVDDYETAAANAAQKFKLEQANLAKEAAQTAETTANTAKSQAETKKTTAETTEVPSEIGLKKAQTAEAYANANKALAEGKKLSAVDANDPNVAVLGEAIARGSLTEDQIPGFSKAKPAIMAYLAQHHPNLDQKSVLLNAGERKQVDLANNSLENVNQIQQILNRRPDLIGVINGRITQGKIGTGTNDRDLGYIEEALDNFGLATTGTHGTKAQAAREDARTALLNGFKNGPQAVAGAIDAAKNSLGNLASAGKPRGTNGQPYVYNNQPTQGAPQSGRAPIAPPPGAPAGATAVYHDQKDPNKIIGYMVNGRYQAVQ